jgi:hypothetical protein
MNNIFNPEILHEITERIVSIRLIRVRKGN